MAVKRLRDYGLKSERLLWPTKGPSVFEEELGVDDLEDKLMLTTLEKAVAWSQSKSMWPDQFGLSCCAMEMIAIVGSRYDVARFGMGRHYLGPGECPGGAEPVVKVQSVVVPSEFFTVTTMEPCGFTNCSLASAPVTFTSLPGS